MTFYIIIINNILYYYYYVLIHRGRAYVYLLIYVCHSKLSWCQKSTYWTQMALMFLLPGLNFILVTVIEKEK
jgi:hypothetical protein